MEFSGQYLTYEEYRALGGTLDLTPFNLLEFESRRLINIRTQNRLKNIETNSIPNEVKLCEYKMINNINGYTKSIDKAINENVKSENTDGYSVTYATTSDIEEIIKSKSAELNDTINNYLLGVVVNGEHIMYAGVK